MANIVYAYRTLPSGLTTCNFESIPYDTSKDGKTLKSKGYRRISTQQGSLVQWGTQKVYQLNETWTKTIPDPPRQVPEFNPPSWDDFASKAPQAPYDPLGHRESAQAVPGRVDSSPCRLV